MRILVRPRLPVVALLFLAPAIPELLTGSTPVSLVLQGPLGVLDFLFRFFADMALYGTGALLIREFAAAYRKGWPSILLLGAAYGIAEEGFAVHTFFQTTGSPVDALGWYGHAFGVNWLWALGLTAFHTTYSIALPILLCQLWFPEVRAVRWLSGGSVMLTAAVYLLIVGVFALVVGHGPSVPALAFFLAVSAGLLLLAWWAPPSLLAPRPGPTRASRTGLVIAGTGGFDAWVIALAFAGIGRIPALFAGLEIVGVNLCLLTYLLRFVGRDDLESAEFYFATGMLLALFGWDIPIGFSDPGVQVVALFFAFAQYRLGIRVLQRATKQRESAIQLPRSPPLAGA